MDTRIESLLLSEDSFLEQFLDTARRQKLLQRFTIGRTLGYIAAIICIIIWIFYTDKSLSNLFLFISLFMVIVAYNADVWIKIIRIYEIKQRNS
jgi:hypothetical protein